jgi:HD-like signal output (HDOD) protein
LKELEALATESDTVNSRHLAGIVLSDPLMTVRLLSHLEATRRASQNHDITTIDRAIMMMGVTPFMHHFLGLETVEAQLANRPKALLGVLKVIGRARRAAHIARDWAIVRHDVDPDEITVAALLHEITDIVCWVHAPELTQAVYELQAANRDLRSTDAQRAVFGVTAHEIQLGLIEAWHLPRLLADLIDDRRSDNPRVRNVVLASSMARHSMRGWRNPALPEDLASAAALLPIGREQILHRLGVPPEDIPALLPAEA